MKAAAIQLRFRRNNPEGAITAALQLLQVASREAVEIACLPELWLPEDYCLKQDGLIEELQHAAQLTGVYLVTGALPQKINGRTEIVSHLISPSGEILGAQSKVHLFRSQRERYQAARSLKIVKTPIGNVGMLVCYDNVFPEAARRLVLDGADLILMPSRIRKEGIDPWQLYVKVRALENRVPLIAPNVSDLPSFNGHSLIVTLQYDRERDIVYPDATEASWREQIVTAELDLNICKRLRERRLTERRPELY